MTIQTLQIASFGGLEDFSLDLADGANILYGRNETGKSSVAAFVKFIFYGLSSRAGKSGVSERARYLNSRTGSAAGTLTVRTDDGGLWRIERSLTAAGERIRIIDRKSGEIVTGEEPGIRFFGVPEDVFVSTCFVSQVSVRPEAPIGQATGGTRTAVENLLASADENVDIRRAEKQLDDLRRELSHKNGGGGRSRTSRKNVPPCSPNETPPRQERRNFSLCPPPSTTSAGASASSKRTRRATTGSSTRSKRSPSSGASTRRTMRKTSSPG
ncbi:MAG: AAA family ATPase [Clostridia bacterium]|nr:AAA family ATPase [Clostridia bacterium]